MQQLGLLAGESRLRVSNTMPGLPGQLKTFQVTLTPANTPSFISAHQLHFLLQGATTASKTLGAAGQHQHRMGLPKAREEGTHLI